MVEGFVATGLRPMAHTIDVDGRIPDAVIDTITRMDLWSLAMPVATGGSDRSTRTFLMVVEELARGSAPVATLAAVHDVAAWVVGQRPTPHAIALDLHHGRSLATGAFPTLDRTDLWCHGHDAGMSHVLTGATPATPGTSDADGVVVVARCGAHGQDDLVLAVVSPDTVGVTLGPDTPMTGLRGSRTASLLLEGVALTPDDVLVDAPDTGRELAARARGRQRRGLAAVAVGLAQSALDGARIHARTAMESGVVLHAHEGVAAGLADMAESVEAARTLQRSAADRADHGVATVRLAAMARRQAGRTAVDVTSAGLRLHAGLGPLTTVPMERLLRDAVSLAALLDTDRDLTTDIAASLVPA